MENHDEFFEVRTTYFFHKRLKGRRRITYAKTHYTKLEMAQGCVESSLVHIFIAYANLTISRSQVQLGEVSAPLNAVKQIVHVGETSFIFNSNSVQLPAITYKSKGSACLFDEKYRCPKLGTC